METLRNRLDRLLRLRNLAIDERNFFKKKQADMLIKIITRRLDTLSNFSINQTWTTLNTSKNYLGKSTLKV